MISTCIGSWNILFKAIFYSLDNDIPMFRHSVRPGIKRHRIVVYRSSPVMVCRDWVALKSEKKILQDSKVDRLLRDKTVCCLSFSCGLYIIEMLQAKRL